MLEVALRYVFNNRDKLTPSQKNMYISLDTRILTNLTDRDLYILYSDLRSRMYHVRKEKDKRILLSIGASYSSEVPVASQVPLPVASQVPLPVASQVPLHVASGVPVPVASGVPVPVAQVPESPLMSPVRQCDSDRCLYTCGEACGMSAMSGMSGMSGMSAMSVSYPAANPISQPVQESVEVAYDTLPTVATLESATHDPKEQNWVECVECKTWRKVDSCDALPEEWICKNIKMPCRPPKEAHLYWPSYVTKTLAKQLGQPWLSHMDALKFLARRKFIRLEELYKMPPRIYNSLEI